MAVKTRTKGATGAKKIAQDLRDLTLFKDGKWRSFPKIPNLLQYAITGSYYGRTKVDGKIYRESLDATVYSVAKQKLPDFVTGSEHSKAFFVSAEMIRVDFLEDSFH